MPPDVEEHVVDDILDLALVLDEPGDEPVHLELMPAEQHAHRHPVAGGDPGDQIGIRIRRRIDGRPQARSGKNTENRRACLSVEAGICRRSWQTISGR